jgi:addiction module RelE/StbE family toxin
VSRKLRNTSVFKRDLRKWVKSHPRDAPAIDATLKKLLNNPTDPQLKTLKLQGSLGDCWSCRVGYDLRILFEFDSDDSGEVIVLLALGTHDEVY